MKIMPKTECNDRHCPKHAGLPVRGTMLEGVVVSDKAKNTVTVERGYLHYVPKYERYQRRTTRIAAHKPGCMQVAPGDKVRLAECRKISKTKSFVVMEKL
ncbi:30S ribosomal protein S17 [Candidatus Micrarchaeota archaeon]|nr:30S ribosomal protein S17 [Candidatus Micrarchaeota archaeon]